MAADKSEISSADIVQRPSESEAEAPVTMEDAVVVPAQEVEEDMILISIKDDDVPDNVLKAVLYGLAEEQSSLRSLRQKKSADGKDTSHISIKRGTLLKYMSETLLQRQALAGPSSDINVRGPKFREIMKMFFEMINESFDMVSIPPEYRDLFFQAFSEKLEGWEDRAEKILKTMENPKK